jgi:hypothetical protein
MKIKHFTFILILLFGLYLIATSLHKSGVHAFDLGLSKTSKSDINMSDIQNGDIIFQISLSGQSQAIQLATRSKYSHCGIIYKEKGQCYVLEAVQPVKSTPLKAWIKRGQDGHYVIKRINEADKLMNTTVINKMRDIGSRLMGKNYDFTFEWSDDKMYCSELVWKIYKRGAGVELCKVQKLRDFDLSHPVVKEVMKKRYGKKIPYDEMVVSPAALYESDKLTLVDAN